MGVKAVLLGEMQEGMSSPVPVKLPVWLGVLPISHPKAVFCAPMLLPFGRGCSDPSGSVRLGSPAFTHSPGKSHSCRSSAAWLGSTYLCVSPFPQKWMSPCTLGALLLPSWRLWGCWAGPASFAEAAGMGRLYSGEKKKKICCVPPLHGFFPPFPYV